MPRKKSKKLIRSRVEKAETNSADSYKSLFYGMATVLVFFVLVFLVLKLVAHKNVGEISDSGISTRSTQNIYVVAKGDTLWKIAQAKYNNGYKWIEIAKANNLANPGSIETGMQLTIPSIVPTAVSTISPSPTPEVSQVPPVVQMGGKITGNSYTVVAGDYLWEIADRAYGDPYKWVDIAKANNLANPDLIYAGNKFIIPK